LKNNIIKNLDDSGITSDSIKLEYEDEDFSEFITLDNICNIPDKAKLRVVSLTSSSVLYPWRFDEAFLKQSGWVEKGYASTKYSSFCIKDNDKVYASDQFQIANSLFSKQLHGDKYTITKIYGLQNESLLHIFEHYQDKLFNQWRVNPKLFRKDDWKDSECAWRTWISEKLKDHIENFEWNNNQQVPVVPMIHGTNEGAVWQICQTGFTTVSTVDAGWFGKGMYFTSDAPYALDYYCKANNEGEKIVIIAFVIPGNVYPVIEDPHEEGENSLKGKPFKNGYQSHFTVVNTEGLPCKIDHKEDKYSELVVFQEAQILPKYVLYVR